MIKALRELHQIQSGFEAADTMLKQSIGVETCISGCGQCCMHNVPYWRTIEAINAVSVLLGTERLKKAVSIAEGWLLEHHKEAASYEGMQVGLASPRIHQEWLDLRLTQCPFLDEKRACLIHEVRPLVCMARGVTLSAVEECPRPAGRGETLTQHQIAISPRLRQRMIEYWAECKAKNQEWGIASFVPTLLYRAVEPVKFKQLVLDNQVASAKVIGVDYEVCLFWQPDLDALRAGISPDLVVAKAGRM